MKKIKNDINQQIINALLFHSCFISHMKYKICVLTVILFGSCNEKKIPLPGPNKEAYHINIEKCLEQQCDLKISDLADTVEYIILNTPPNIIISSIRKIELYQCFIFLQSRGLLFQFDINGRYIRQIGRKGRGPGEYVSASDFFIDTCKNEIAISSYPRILYYNFNGEYLRYINVRAPHAAYSDSVIWGSLESLGLEKYRLVGINERQDTIAKIPNYIFYNLNRTSVYGVTSKITYSFYNYNSQLFYKGYEDNDTVWNISKMGCRPHLVFDLGKYKLPLEYQPSYSKESFQRVGKKYFSIPKVLEDDHFVYITSGPIIKDELFTHCILYDKMNNIGSLAFYNKKPGIQDDILNGPPIWPYAISDHYYIGCIEAFQILDYCKNIQNVHLNLKEILNQINESTNQLVVLCKRKKRKLKTIGDFFGIYLIINDQYRSKCR